MIKINITEEDKEICEYEGKHHIHPSVRQKTDDIRNAALNIFADMYSHSMNTLKIR